MLNTDVFDFDFCPDHSTLKNKHSLCQLLSPSKVLNLAVYLPPSLALTLFSSSLPPSLPFYLFIVLEVISYSINSTHGKLRRHFTSLGMQVIWYKLQDMKWRESIENQFSAGLSTNFQKEVKITTLRVAEVKRTKRYNRVLLLIAKLSIERWIRIKAHTLLTFIQYSPIHEWRLLTGAVI